MGVGSWVAQIVLWQHSGPVVVGKQPHRGPRGPSTRTNCYAPRYNTMHHKNKNKYNKFTNTWRPNQCAPQYNTNTKTVKTYQHYNTLNTLLSKLHTHCQHTTITSLHFRVHYWKLHCMYYLQRAAMQQGSVESSESQNILPQAISHNTHHREHHTTTSTWPGQVCQ